MNILITHAYAKENKGDAAILSVLLGQLREAFPKSNIKISIFDDIRANKMFEGFETISSFLYLAYCTYHHAFAKTIYSLYIILATIIWASVLRFFHINLDFILKASVRQVAHEFKKADLIVPIGGGYIRATPTLKDTFALILLLHPILLSIILKKPVILYSQSIGPFFNVFQKTITKLVLNHTKLILVREDNTLATLKSIGIKDQLVVRSVDAGFLFQADTPYSLQDIIPSASIKNKTLVGITVRQWMKKTKQEAYQKAIVDFIDEVTKDKNIMFVFIPQVSSTLHNDDDRDIATAITNGIKNKDQVINLTGIYDHHQVKALYSDLDFIVGTRFHSVIFSLTAFVPALAIEYEYKTSGIMKDLDLSEWVIPIEDVTTEMLYDKFMSLMKHKKAYEAKLHANLPAYIDKAKRNVIYLKQNAKLSKEFQEQQTG